MTKNQLTTLLQALNIKYNNVINYTVNSEDKTITIDNLTCFKKGEHNETIMNYHYSQELYDIINCCHHYSLFNEDFSKVTFDYEEEIEMTDSERKNKQLKAKIDKLDDILDDLVILRDRIHEYGSNNEFRAKTSIINAIEALENEIIHLEREIED